MDSETGSKRGRGRGRGRARGRGRGRGRGRPKKMVIESDDEEQQIETSETVDNMVEILEEPVSDILQSSTTDSFLKTDTELGSLPKEHEFSIDDDISTLIPPTFSTLSSGPPQPMVELDWNHNYNPSAERVPSPNIHMCVSCSLPIRLYGRLIPCKHVYCYYCATKQIGKCSRCNENVHRIETAHLGSVHMCNHDGSRYGFDGCRRTYLSQRDLQAHINHRHKPRNIVSTSEGLSRPQHGLPLDSAMSGYPPRQSSSISVHTSRSNLIPVSMHSSSSPRIKPDSQSLLIPSPENSSTPTSTGSRYERERERDRKSSSSSSSYSSLYSRPNRQFRQF